MDQEEFHRMLSRNLVVADQKKNSSSLEVNPLTYITRSYQI